jgi:hypothetical protein
MALGATPHRPHWRGAWIDARFSPDSLGSALQSRWSASQARPKRLQSPARSACRPRMMMFQKARAPLTGPKSNRPNTGRIDAVGADIIVGGVDTIVDGADVVALSAGAFGGADAGGGAVVLSADDGGSPADRQRAVHPHRY